MDASAGVLMADYLQPGPCPAAYNVKDSIATSQPPVSVFGTSRRENEAFRYISSLHNAALPPHDTPGPGTYRQGWQ
eukprot:scaffold183187_cov16-Tisochrysis_lutea.AAC.1